MVLSRRFSVSSVVRFGFLLASVSAWFFGPQAHAQYSSSAQYHADIETLIQDQGQNRGGYSRQGYYQSSTFSHIAIEAGGGFNRPLGFSRSFATWGGNITLGGGWNFNKMFGVLAEWQFLDNKIPGSYLVNVGVPGGHIHTWGFNLQPIAYYHQDATIGGYVTGGGGFYRRVTTFTTPETSLCGSIYFTYYCTINVPVAHYSSNQGGLNLGVGVTWKAFGPDSNGKIFGEVRYLWVDSPKTNVFGLPDGTLSALPVTVGLRW